MRVTFVLPCPCLSGGMRVIGIYAKSLQDRGHEVSFVSTPLSQPDMITQTKSILKGQGFIHVPHRLPNHLDQLDIQHNKLQRFRPIQDTDVPDGDIVIATWWETAEWVWNLSPRKGKKVYLIQDYEIWGGQVDRVHATYRLPMTKIVIASWLKTLLEEKFQQSAVELISNSVDSQKFNAPPRGKQAVPTVGLLYAAIPRKGADISLAAYQLAKQEIPDLKLVAFGENPVSPELPLPDGATYYQQPADHLIKEIYSQCDAWLFGTRVEGFGLPILEAMACRTPVIGTPAGAAPDFLGDGAGILVKPEDPEDMAQAITRVCRMSDAEWRSLSSRAYERISHYTWEDAVDKFEAVLKAAVAQSAPSLAQVAL